MFRWIPSFSTPFCSRLLFYSRDDFCLPLLSPFFASFLIEYWTEFLGDIIPEILINVIVIC